MNIDQIKIQFTELGEQFTEVKRKLTVQTRAMSRLRHDIHRFGQEIANKKLSPSLKFANKNIKLEQKKIVKELNEIQKNRKVVGRRISKLNASFKTSHKKIADYVDNKGIFKKSVEKRTAAAQGLLNKLALVPNEMNGKVDRVTASICALQEKSNTIRAAAQSQTEILRELHELKTSLAEFELSYAKDISRYAEAEKTHPDLAFARARLKKIKKDIVALEEHSRTKNAFDTIFCTMNEDPTAYIQLLNQLTEIKYELENKQLFIERHLSDEQRVLREPTQWERLRGIQLERIPSPVIPASHRGAEAHEKIDQLNQEVIRIKGLVNYSKITINALALGDQQKAAAIAYCDGKLKRIELLKTQLNEKNTLSEMLLVLEGQPFPLVTEIERELAAIERRIGNHVQKLNPAPITGTELEKNRRRAEKNIEEFIDTENSFYLDGIKLSIACLQVLRNYVNNDTLFEVEEAYQVLEKAVSDFNEELREVERAGTLEAKVERLQALFNSEVYTNYSQALLNFSVHRIILERMLTSFQTDRVNNTRYLRECESKLSVVPDHSFIHYAQRAPRHILLMTELLKMLPHCQIENLNLDTLRVDILEKNKSLVGEMNNKRNAIELELYLKKLDRENPQGITYKQYVNLLHHSISPSFNRETSEIVRERLDVLFKRGLELKLKSVSKAERQFKEQKMKAIDEFYKRKSRRNSGVLAHNVTQCDIELKGYIMQIAANPLETEENVRFARNLIKTYGPMNAPVV